MHGRLEQLESWDPKPGTETGGPFRAISTSVPGIQVSELLPNVARQMHHLARARGEHQRGRTRQGGLPHDDRAQADARRQLPEPRAVCAKAMAPDDGALPGHIVITPGAAAVAATDSAYLGPKYASIHLGNGNAPQNTIRPGQVSEPMDDARHAFRRRSTTGSSTAGATAVTEAYTYSYEQAIQLMGQREVFDVGKEPAKDHERYGKHDLGRHCLLARRLLEKGATLFKSRHSN